MAALIGWLNYDHNNGNVQRTGNKWMRTRINTFIGGAVLRVSADGEVSLTVTQDGHETVVWEGKIN